MVVKHECKKCGKKFELVMNETMCEEVLTSSVEYGKMLYVTKTHCPDCGYDEIVQVDDDKTKEIVRKIVAKVRIMNVSARKKSGKNFAREKMQIKTMNELLEKRRSVLFEELKVVS